MRYLNTLYVTDHRGQIAYRRNSLVITRPEGTTRVPLESIDGVVIIGHAQITNQALTECVKRNVLVAGLRRNGSVKFLVEGSVAGNVHLRSRQHETSCNDYESTQLAKMFVAGKLQNSRRVISRWARDSDVVDRRNLEDLAAVVVDRLGRVPSASSANQLRGVEGDAARAHFKAMGQTLSNSSLHFTARRRRPPRDPVNAMLGFCYGLAATECEGAACAAGLDPQIGFLHRARSGRQSLALDLLEELRPLIDRFVVTLIRTRQINSSDFVTVPGGAVYLNDDGRRRLLAAWEKHKNSELQHVIVGRPVQRWALPTVQATLLVRHLRGDLETYPPFVLAA